MLWGDGEEITLYSKTPRLRTCIFPTFAKTGSYIYGNWLKYRIIRFLNRLLFSEKKTTKKKNRQTNKNQNMVAMSISSTELIP